MDCVWLGLNYSVVFNIINVPVLISLVPSSADLVCWRDVSYTLIRYQSPMYTERLSAFIQSKELWLNEGICWKGVGAVGHRERIVSSAQWSFLPSSCARPWFLAALDLVGCVCMFWWVFVYRRMPPIWGWTAVLSTSFRELSQLDKN